MLPTIAESMFGFAVVSSEKQNWRKISQAGQGEGNDLWQPPANHCFLGGCLVAGSPLHLLSLSLGPKWMKLIHICLYLQSGQIDVPEVLQTLCCVVI